MSETAASQRAQYPLAAYNFRVTVGESVMSFTEVSGLVQEYQTLTYKHGLSFWEGESINRFRYDKYVQLTLKKGVMAGLTGIYEWLDSGDQPGLSISLCDEEGNAVVTWQIRKALIVKLEAPPLQASGNEVAIETLTLMASGISVEHH
ncbi:phage tail protein [Accumulibacter sp.]|jgi:phage tail-like protein|uniref:phage tail protein n=1 Tax=Accumulibacter sp. TaxID=2053492 RepID=UPI001ACF7310|nr:phage tail protein [Accumulibacter sp.]MBN8447449.1 phage tail protein [Candidatus Accumulibacter necessarius]MBN8452072.1 phage tail protein [Accumulibacter sp.]